MTDGLLAPQRRAVTVGLVLTVSMVAFEALAVATVVPQAARELHGLRLYGWVFSAFMLANLVGIVVGGAAADRRGPAPPFAAGLVLFAAGLVVGGVAPTMAVLVAGRAVQGLGAGAVLAVAYVGIGRGFPEHLRPRMMAALSTGWVVPGLVGPFLAGLVADQLTWRLVFFAVVAVTPVVAALALPALAAMGPAEGLATTATATATTATAATAERVARPGAVALRLATGAGLVVAGLSARSVLVAVPAVLAGAILAVPAARRLLPPGTAVARPGLPAAVATRGLVAFAFFGTEAFLTLALTTVRRRSAAEAGLVLTSSTLSWATGSWGQARLAGRWPRQRVAVVGIAVVVAGLAGVSSVLFEAVTIPVAVAAACWAVTGFGMGLAYPTTTLAMLAEAAPGREGSASSALQLADVLGVALGTGLGGAAVALFLSLGQTRRVGIAVAFSLCLGAAGLSLLSARRLGGVREAADDAGAEMALPGGSTAVRLGG